VASASLLRGTATVTREEHDETQDESFRVEENARVTSSYDGRLLIRHDGGSRLLLDHGSAATLSLDTVTLESGRAWVEGAEGGGEHWVVRGTRIQADGATFAVEF